MATTEKPFDSVSALKESVTMMSRNPGVPKSSIVMLTKNESPFAEAVLLLTVTSAPKETSKNAVKLLPRRRMSLVEATVAEDGVALFNVTGAGVPPSTAPRAFTRMGLGKVAAGRVPGGAARARLRRGAVGGAFGG